MKAALRRIAAFLLLAWAFAAAATDLLEARSADGRWILRADNERRELAAIDTGSGKVFRRIAVADRRGARSRVARLVDAPPRHSFIVLLADVAEAWELSYDPNAEPVYDGLVHDYRLGEGIADRGPFAVRRIHLDEPLTDAQFSADFSQFTATTADGATHVVNLHVRRVIEKRKR